MGPGQDQTRDPWICTSSIPARSRTFVEIDHEMISTVILLHSADSFKKGCCQLQAKVCAQITGLTETKLSNFHGIFKNGAGRGFKQTS